MHGGEHDRRLLATCERAEQLTELTLGELGRDVQHRHLEQLVAAVSDLLARALVHVGELQRRGIEHEYRVAGDVECLPHFTMGRLVGHPFADVAHDRDDPEAVVTRQRAQADLDRELGAVGASAEQHESRTHRSQSRLGAVSRPVGAVHLTEVVGEQVVDRPPEQVTTGVAEEIVELAVAEQDPAVLVGHQQAVGRGVDEGVDRRFLDRRGRLGRVEALWVHVEIEGGVASGSHRLSRRLGCLHAGPLRSPLSG